MQVCKRSFITSKTFFVVLICIKIYIKQRICHLQIRWVWDNNLKILCNKKIRHAFWNAWLDFVVNFFFDFITVKTDAKIISKVSGKCFKM